LETKKGDRFDVKVTVVYELIEAVYSSHAHITTQTHFGDASIHSPVFCGGENTIIDRLRT
jgi:hypothetical protein